MSQCILTLQSDHQLSIVLRNRALEIARKEDWEKPGREGYQTGDVTKYRLAVGQKKTTHNYCVAFINWCYEQAILEMKECGQIVANPLPWHAVGASQLLTHARTQGKLLNPEGKLKEPLQPGDIYINDHHAAFIRETPTRLTKVKTIEGNTWKKIDGVTVAGVLHRDDKDLSDCFFARY